MRDGPSGIVELKEYLEVRGYADAASWVYGQGLKPDHEPGVVLTLTEVRRIHMLAMQSAWDVAPHPEAGPDEGPGSFRRHDIASFPGGMTPPTWPLVDAEMGSWIEQAAALRPRTPAFPEQVAGLHAAFERIHPFLDGNGRAGRLTLNLMLVRLGYPPAIVYKSQRRAYLAALRRADAGDPGASGELIARAILDNLYRFVVPAVAGPARLVPLAALATQTLNASALRTAAVRGALQATKGADGQWRSSRAWVEEYVRTRHRRRY